MGGVCGKEKKGGKSNSQVTKNQYNVKIIEPPKGAISIRAGNWVGLKNLHNTCYINSGMAAV